MLPGKGVADYDLMCAYYDEKPTFRKFCFLAGRLSGGEKQRSEDFSYDYPGTISKPFI